ncbi:CotH kinase family protein [Cohnella massiliensis]|uniref:CotH kinase family protein n=1 Tax=Cohnella massiliensis TaxID=1816691 RepID=UPI0009B97454|nr:CotH kinase family protein [Cohnella massiliensis]
MKTTFRFRAAPALLLALAVCLGLSGCSFWEEPGEQAAETAQAAEPVQKSAAVASLQNKLMEDRRIYADDKADSVVTFYLTITEDNLTGDPALTWNELNGIRNAQENTDEKKVNVLIQEGNETGPASGMLGYGETRPNGELSLRGKSTLQGAQKSYKIKLFDEAGVWRDQTTINLLKHIYDFSRVRNTLSMDYFKLIPNMTSYRTQFVHLYVKDMTSGETNPVFVDYGLYEQIEQPNKRYLRARGLDPNGQLYKAENFEFFRYADKLISADDADYDQAAFESVLEIKGSKDHEKLLRMLDDVNNLSLNFDEVFDRHFDRDNYLTWMASNILMDNIDTISQNFLLYSPLNSNTWFFLPWDYDGGWGYNEFAHADELDQARAPWMRGIQNYWGTVLANRFFKNPDNVQQLIDKVKELQTIIHPERTAAFLDTYRDVVYPYISRQPDMLYLPGNVKDYDAELERIAGLPEKNAEQFIANLQKPMPFFMGDVEQDGSNAVFRWDASYDLQGDDLIYRFRIAKDPTFAKPLVDRDGLTVTSLTIENLEMGRYFWQVTATDAEGNSMPAFDIYEGTDDIKHYGVREFYID